MWARVKFNLDNQVLNRPLTYFKGHEVIEKELRCNEIREMYQVFWSNNASDTPDEILRREGRILDVDSIVQAVGSVPVVGYYKATLQNYANSEEKLLQLLKTRPSRRTPKATVTTSPMADKVSTRVQKMKDTASKIAAAEFNKNKFILQGSSSNESSLALGLITKTAIPPKPDSVIEDNAELLTENLSKQTSHVPVPKMSAKTSIHISKLPKKRKTEGSTSDSESDDGDNVPLVQYKEKLKDIRSLKRKLEVNNQKLEEAKQALKEVLNNCEKLESQNKTLMKDKLELETKISELSTELLEYISLNKWWQQQELMRKESQKSSQHHDKSKLSLCNDSIGEESSQDEEVPNATTSMSRKGTTFDAHPLSPVSTPVTPSSTPVTPSPTSLTPRSTPGTSRSTPMASHMHTPRTLLSSPPEKNVPLQLTPTTSTSSLPMSPPQYESVDLDMLSSPTSIDDGHFRPGNIDVRAMNKDEIMKLMEESNPADVAFGMRPIGVKPITYAQFEHCLKQNMKNKPGKDGDSMFIKKLSSALWDPEVLKERSAAGKAASTSDGPPRPECTPAKRAYIADLLKVRIKMQENVTDADILSRTKDTRIKEPLRSKIKALNRPNRK